MSFTPPARTSRPAGFRASATLHRSAPHGLSRRRRLGLAALAGGTAVAATSGLAAVLATGAYASPRAATTTPAAPTTTAAAYLREALMHESQLGVATHVQVAERAAAVKQAQQAESARAVRAASRSETRAPLASAASFTGLASWYGPGFQGRPTASGEPYDQDALTAASRTLPLGTHLQVCHHGSCVTVLINDWGPVPRSRVLDLSRAAAERIGIYDAGVGEVTATPVGAGG
jgi:rare lipoprotein A (peptidoglycan hydrolase)